MINKTRAVARKYGAKLAAAPTLALVLMGQAHAELPEEVGTAIAGAKTDLLAAIGLVIAAMVAVWGLRKLGQKMGWI